MYFASPEVVDETLQAYGWTCNGTTDNGAASYSNPSLPTFTLYVGQLGTYDAYMAVEDAHGRQFADCDLYSEWDGEAVDYMDEILNKLRRGIYNQFA